MAAAILALSLAALMSVVPVASYAVQDGNQTSTATFLHAATTRTGPQCDLGRDHRLRGTLAERQLAPAPSPAGTCGAIAVTYADEATLSGFAQYARTVRITDCGVTPCGAVTSFGDASGQR